MRERGMSRAREQRLRRGGLFVPLVFALAAEIEGLSVEELLVSPTKLSNGLRTMFSYFGLDGVASWCDNTALAATLGSDRDWSLYPPAVVPPPEGSTLVTADISTYGPTGVAAEVVRRLSMLLPDAVLVGTMPGPVTLAGQLAGHSVDTVRDPEQLRRAAGACLAYAKALGEAGLDVLLVCEQELLTPNDTLGTSDVARLYSPIWNTARFYALAALLVPQGWGNGRATSGSGPADAEVTALAAVSAAVDGVVLPAGWAQTMTGFKRLGLALPSRLPSEPVEVIEEYLRDNQVADRVHQDGLFLVTTDGEVPPDTERAALITGIRTIRDHIRGGTVRG